MNGSRKNEHDDDLVQLRVRRRADESSRESPSRATDALEPSRRDFLSLVGFGLGAATVAACKAPVQHAIPLTTASDAQVPGVANWYATTCGGCPSSCPITVKQRDGRPIKIEGNDRSVLFGGGTCAAGQATVLSLYDEDRLRGPRWGGHPIAWNEIDARIGAAVRAAARNRQRVVLLSGTITSPSTLHIIREYAERLPGFRHVTYDPISLSAVREANGASFGRAVIPHYVFDRAQTVVGLEADYLGTWLSPVEFAAQYGRARRERRAFHVQCESGLSLTGSNADMRIAAPPSEMGTLALALLRRIAERSGAGSVEVADPVDSAKLDAIADRLWKHRGESIVISGQNDVAVQMVVNALNAWLGNVGRTIDFTHPSRQRQGDDRAMAALVDDMTRGEVSTLIVYGVNPAYDYAEADRFARGLEKVELSVSFADRSDETGSRVLALCPDHHFLEAWGDAEPVVSQLSLRQPTIAPIFDTRSAPESLIRWLGHDVDHYTYLRSHWRAEIFPRQTQEGSFDTFWDRSLERGIAEIYTAEDDAATFHGDWRAAAGAIVEACRLARAARTDDRCEVRLYESVAIRDGGHANNPWLQELPDPISKVTWGNFAALSPLLCERLGVTTGDVLSIEHGAGTIELPALVQPGHDSRTLSIALGYGRRGAGRAADNVGVNAYPLAAMASGARGYSTYAIVKRTGRHESLARSQTHFSMEGRPIVQEIGEHELAVDPEGGAEHEALATLWASKAKGDHAWGMAIDIDACTGCSACVVACQAENNVAVVGKEQVKKDRIMHWLRIDRYDIGSDRERSSVHQPMMCQHCQNAPCESVCPVLATTTSSEGLNQQVYNRCIGTRYCANNCPYKVRRFNWHEYADPARFDFTMGRPLVRMVLNPDVTVRSRGVMEKCSLCVQRIQGAKNTARKRRTPLSDGDIRTACAEVCPTQAIVFGDLSDRESRVSILARSQRAYRVLDELGTRPNVTYLKKVRHV